MAKLLMLSGLIIVISSLLFILFRKSTEEDPQQAYVLKGLVLSVFAVGAFSVGNWLIGMLFANTLDSNFETLAGWIFAVPLILLFIGLSEKRKPVQVPLKVRNIETAGKANESKVRMISSERYGQYPRSRGRYLG